MANFSTDWPFWLAAALLGLLSASILYRSLLHNRSRGRRRCPKCWYDMSGVNGWRCPECGRDAKHERRLFRTRRRWGWGGVALVVSIAAYGVWTTPKVRRSGWPAAVPSSILILGADGLRNPTFNESQALRAGRSPPIAAALGRELGRRITDDELAPWQLDWILRWSIAHGGLAQQAPTLPWDDHYPWSIGYRAMVGRKPPLEAPTWFIQRAGDAVAARSLHVRPRWPTDVPIKLRLRRDRLFGYPFITGTVVQIWSGDREQLLYQAWMSSLGGSAWGDMAFEIGPLPPGFHALKFGLTIRTDVHREDDPYDGRVVWNGVTTAAVEVAGNIQDHLTPYESQEFEALGAGSSWWLMSHEKNRIWLLAPSALLGLGEGYPDWALPDDVTLAVSIMLLRDGAPVAAGDVWWVKGPMNNTLDPLGEFGTSSRVLVEALREVVDDQACSDWSVLVTGDPTVALRNLHASKYWDGQFIAPVETGP